MRGEFVIARTFGDKPVMVRIWDFVDGVVLVTDGEGLKLLKAIHPLAPSPIGFRQELIFSPAGKNAEEILQAWEAGSWFWEDQELWQPSN